MSRFDRDTAVTQLEPGRFRAQMDRGWWITNGPNGGYLAAVVLRAMTRVVDEAARTARSLTVHYVRPPQDGEVEIAVDIERAGRTLSYLRAQMHQNQKLQLLATATFSTRAGGLEFQDAQMPTVPLPSELGTAEPTGSIGMHERYDRRWVYGSREGTSSPVAECAGWIRLADPRPYDSLLIAALCDAWPPPIFQRRDTARSGVPTLDLTVHIRAPLQIAALRPDEHVFGRYRTRSARDGFIEEDGELWSQAGVLLAQSRQLAVLT